MRRTATLCSWCHEMVSVDYQHCPTCGHEAHTPRLHCRCVQCKGSQFPLEEAFRRIHQEEVRRQLIDGKK